MKRDEFEIEGVLDYTHDVARDVLGTLPVPGQHLGPYEILAEIAHGGMAAVYLARKRFEVAGLGKLFAVKVILPHLRDREFVEMFLDEARVSIAIAHPNVVQVIDVDESDHCPFIVMEYLRGQSLGGVVRKAREAVAELGDGLLFQVLAQTAAGLHAAHETTGEDRCSLGIVHRDVTPHNIHVGYDGCVKVLDFGIAASRGRVTATRPNVLKGTFHYLAPEQISRSRSSDRRVDLWALGVVAWEMLVGRSLFRGDDEATTLWNVLNMEVTDLRSLVPRVPDAVAGAIMACLARDPDRRPPNARQLEEIFADAAHQSGVGSRNELAAMMTTLFEDERRQDGERINAVVRASTSTTAMVTVSTRPATAAEPTNVLPRRRGRRSPVALIGGFVVAVGVTAALVVADGQPQATAASAPGEAAGASTATGTERMAGEAGTGTGSGTTGGAADAGAGTGGGTATGVMIPVEHVAAAEVGPTSVVVPRQRPQPSRSRRATSKKPHAARGAGSTKSKPPTADRRASEPEKPAPEASTPARSGPLLDNPYR